MKDLFIDTNNAVKLNRPQTGNFRSLYLWLKSDEEALLVVSQKLLVEYYRSCGSRSGFSFILDNLTRFGRMKKFEKSEIEEFKCQYYRKIRFRSNKEDQELIPIVLLSERKYALTSDINLKYDLENFPKFGKLVKVSNDPDNIPYNEI
ncbi:MAG: hypothetical protein LBJ72_04335 [Dysgonamonadaceae bacterium]|jgi:hypothetical protein|nr:hypothetical protein [Dysgonamonadaceae bacterium]